ncbi:MAG: cobalt transporter CbiM [Candidatus Brocadiaceae bacterium]|nr:cobalt transporter CbiM [Candidatus Brocadiaceae bacterium]
MHISDGVLSPAILIAGWGITFPAVTFSVKRLHTDTIGVYGVIAAAFFAGSTIHIPIGPFSMHLLLTGIAGLLLGWGALMIITVGLFLQALFFGYGGLVVLGVNISIMAMPGAIMGTMGRRWIRNASEKKRPWIGAVVGSVTIVISATLLFAALSTTHPGFVTLGKLVFLGHIPVAIIEGFIGYWLIHFLQKVKPELIGISS